MYQGRQLQTISYLERQSSIYSSGHEMTRIIDYDGVTVDHLVPAGGPHPEELQINIIGVENPCCGFEWNAENHRGQGGPFDWTRVSSTFSLTSAANEIPLCGNCHTQFDQDHDPYVLFVSTDSQ
ncbi:hypothetical protein PDE_00147 [Penicillium oxalicum 114-2]|uniref:Uncharacterized protein n=1 Tax=Penicillium oxalicum (strain 114-2 / CGMCC 5302) TaxID=933388 RepID=S7Z3W5_PENO1|nr:hypothetical protein PDE_00147 [Penicillium oxalicum 114-2]